MALLTGDLAKAIYSGFKGKLLTGELRRETPSAAVDEYGDPLAPTISYTAIEGFTSSYSEFFRAQAGIPDTDLKVQIFAQSAPSLVPNKDDKVLFLNQWYQVRKVKKDPATALWTCQSFAIEPPVDSS
jgi:hypothetical protein